MLKLMKETEVNAYQLSSACFWWIVFSTLSLLSATIIIIIFSCADGASTDDKASDNHVDHGAGCAAACGAGCGGW